MRNSISIIMTVRNEGQNIGTILDSLFNQTVGFDEAVINDNGSSDGTVALIKEYQGKHPKIKLIESKNQSIGRGRNMAIENSSGDILAVMDAGISPTRDWLENITRPLLEDADLDVAWGNIIFDTKSRIIPSSDISIGLVFLTKYPENRQQGRNVPSSAFRKRVWQRMGKFPEIDLPIEDLVLIDIISKRDFKTVWVGNAIAYYFKYPTSYISVFKKWITSACSSFIVKKSELGFCRQFMKFLLLFIFILMTFFNAHFIHLIFIYILVFFISKYRLNAELGKTIFRKPNVLLTIFNLFLIINFARVIGVLKAMILIISGEKPQILYNNR